MGSSIGGRPLVLHENGRRTGGPSGGALGRWQGVDALRGAAVLLVICRHHQATGSLGAFGWLGVDLFFVLSGFLVSGLIFDEYRRTGRFNAGRFLIRRGFKIYPSFYALILVSALLMWATGRQDPLMNYVAEILFFQNYHEGLWVQTWSIAVEEHFYLMLTLAAVLLIMVRQRFTWKAMLVTCGLLFGLFLGLRMLTYPTARFDEHAHMFPTHLRIDSLLAGVLLAALHRFRGTWFQSLFERRSLVLGGVMLVLLIPVLFSRYGSWTMSTIGFTGAYLAGAVAVGMVVARSASASSVSAPSVLHRWIVRALAWVGGISYTTYLWHLLVLLVVEMGFTAVGMKGSAVEFVVFSIGSVGMGWLASVMVEQPFLRLRERWFSRMAMEHRDAERAKKTEHERITARWRPAGFAQVIFNSFIAQLVLRAAHWRLNDQ